MIQPGFAAIGPGGTYGSPSFVNNGGTQGNNGNGAYDNGSNNEGGVQMHPNGLGPHDVQQGGQGQMQPDYSLAGILHFLQSEWRRYERDRNEWEIERAEMRARVALLEGERRSIENLKTDLMRRVKMLEFALRHERSKYLASSSSTSTGAQAVATGTASNAVNPKHAALQNQDKASTSSGRSSPAFGDGGQLNETLGLRNQSTIASQNFSTINVGSINGSTMGGNATMQTSLGGGNLARQTSSAKDPKARAKSREYLKQCLQEISYLTSASTLNPLAENSQPSSLLGPGHARPRKTLSDNVPSTFTSTAEQGMTPAALRRQRTLEKVGSIGSATGRSASGRSTLPFGETLEEKDEEEQTSTEGAAKGDDAALSAVSARTEDLQSESQIEHPLPEEAPLPEEEREKVTAIHRPAHGDPAATDDWARLRQAGQIEREKRERARAQAVDDIGSKTGAAPRTNIEDEELSTLSLDDGEDEEVSRLADETAKESQMWKSKRVLRGHLDSVRAIVFDSADLGLYSASDDGTIKYWRVDAEGLKHNKPQTQSTGSDSDPVATLRGHSGMVTCMVLSKAKERLYSGSVDSSVVVWRLLNTTSVEPYPPFDKTSEIGRLVGHTQPVWDLCIMPMRGDEDGLLVSASADGTVKIWSLKDGEQVGSGAELVLTFDYFGTEPGAEKQSEKDAILAKEDGVLPVPTSVTPCMSDLRRIAVSYNNAVVKLFDVQTGKEVMQLASDAHYDGTSASQINKIITHPTLPILISGHENNYIQFFDLTSGACTLSMVAHLDSVASLDIDPSGLTLVSGGHDCSVRFWDIFGSQDGDGDAVSGGKARSNDSKATGANGSTAVCVQEITAHRKKNTEGVLVVKYHPNATWFCSAGADGVIRIYG